MRGKCKALASFPCRIGCLSLHFNRIVATLYGVVLIELSFLSMPTSIEELEQWMKAPKETEGLEFKAARMATAGEKFLEYCIAIGNERGGKLVLGVTDKLPRMVCGTPAVGDPGGMRERFSIRFTST